MGREPTAEEEGEGAMRVDDEGPAEIAGDEEGGDDGDEEGEAVGLPLPKEICDDLCDSVLLSPRSSTSGGMSSLSLSPSSAAVGVGGEEGEGASLIGSSGELGVTTIEASILPSSSAVSAAFPTLLPLSSVLRRSRGSPIASSNASEPMDLGLLCPLPSLLL